MQTLSLSKKAFRDLKPFDIPREVFNTEGNIYEFRYKRAEKILKALHHLEGHIFANKLYTIEMLNTFRQYLPENFYVPDYLVAVSNEIVGFTVPKASGINLKVILNDKSIETQEKVFYLKQVGFVLEQLKNIRKYTPLNHFYLNDLHESNFNVNVDNKQINVFDLDSCKIAANSSFPARFLTPMSLANLVPEKYNISDTVETSGGGYIVANEESDLYCYSIMILNYLYGSNVNNLELEEFYSYLNYLESLGIDKDLLDSFSYLVVPHHNENPLNYLDSLTSEQIYRANNSVYSRVKK